MPDNSVRVLVSGGGGFIGARVVRELLREGINVRIFDRDPPSQWHSGYPAPECVRGDVRDLAAVGRAMAGVTHVVHAAACVAGWVKDLSVMYDVNVGGTRNMVRGALEAGVRSFVHISSGSAVMFAGSGILDERSISERTVHVTDYGRSKALAESEAMAMSAHGGHAVIVYPTRVFGEGRLDDSNAAARVFSLYLHGRLPVLPRGGSDFANWAFADDVARGIVRALFFGRSGERYILGGENARLCEVLRMADDIAGLRHRILSVPYGFGKALASTEELRAALARTRPRITRAWYDAAFENVRLSCAHAIRDLGYSITPLRNALTIVVPALLSKQDDVKRSGQP